MVCRRQLRPRTLGKNRVVLWEGTSGRVTGRCSDHLGEKLGASWLCTLKQELGPVTEVSGISATREDFLVFVERHHECLPTGPALCNL